jgi:hypothetical protein
VALAAALFIGLSPAGAASEALPGVGTLHRATRLTLGANTTLVQTTLTHQSAGLQEERYIEWNADPGPSAIVGWGGKVYGGTFSLEELRLRLEAQGKEITAVLNGDFFTLSNGMPIGLQITEGVLRASEQGCNYIGFPDTGGAYIASAPLAVTLTAALEGGARDYKVDQVNHVRSAGRVSLFSLDFGGNTQTTAAGVHVLLSTDGPLRVGGTVSGTVTEVLTGTAPVVLRPGLMVLSVQDADKARLEGLAPGVSFSLRVSCADVRLAACSYAVGAYQKLLTNGQTVSGLPSDLAPRTAVGVRADGSCVFYTVDGRQSGYSVGLSLPQVAARLQSLGCVEAVNLDGGGSTFLAARYPGQSALTITGQPSDGALRKLPDYIVLVNDKPRQGFASQLFAYPQGALVLAGASTTFSAYAVDGNYHPETAPAVSWQSSDGAWGRFDGARFTALSAGTREVSAQGGGLYAAAAVRVVDQLDTLQILNEKTGAALTALSVSPGETVSLTARGLVDKVRAVSQDTCFTWTVSAGLGTVTAEGGFTANTRLGVTGALTVSYNGLSVTLPVSVGKAPVTVADFESDGGRFGPSAGITLAPDPDPEQAQVGRRAGRLTYDFSGLPAGQALSLSARVPFTGAPGFLSLWVAGDGSGHRLSLGVTNAAGAESEATVCTLDFTGYRLFHIALPANAARISSVRLTPSAAGPVSGSLATDHWTASQARYQDTQAPRVTLAAPDTASQPGTLLFSATLLDGETALRPEDVALQCDGAALPFAYNPASGLLTARLPLDGGAAHRLTLDAADPAGNRLRASWDLPAAGASAPLFDDLPSAHWAAGFIDYLARRGVVEGTGQGSTARFEPDAPITRADMAIFTVRMLKIDLSAYDGLSVPLADLDQLSGETLRAARALYALNIVKGRLRGGQLWFDPTAPISRAEFCTLLGRTLLHGYANAPAAFADAAVIPAYAKGYIDTLTALGVLSGYPDKTFRPEGNITRAEAVKVLYLLY